MALPIPDPQAGGKAWPLSASWWKRIMRVVRGVSNMEIRRGDTDEIFHGDSKIVLQLASQAESSSTTTSLEVKRCAITAVNTDYLTCSPSDGSGTINVAFPDLLRGSAPITGAAIKPAYTTSDYITAVKPSGGTGEATATEWIDINADSRAWCMYLDVCISGTEYSYWIPCTA